MTAAAIGVVVAGPASAQAVPGVRQASILTRALAYDRNMKGRAGEAVVVAVLYKPGNPASEAAANELLQAFKGLEKFAVHGLPFRAVRHPFDGVANLREAIRVEGIDALYVCPGFENEIEVIGQLTRDRKVVSMGAREEYVTRALSIGVFVLDSKPTILLNRPVSQNEGADFSADLIRLAKVIN